MSERVGAMERERRREAGQSLVELALFMPIFLIIIIGLIEVSQLVITQNRISNAARIGARFGANGGEDEGMALVVLNAVTQTLDLSPNRWDIWTIRGTVNPGGDGFLPETWQFEHVYGISNTRRFSDVVELEIQAQVLAELRTDQFGDPDNPGNIAGDLRVVGSYILHDVQSLLNLQILPSIRALSVMRLTGGSVEQTTGCSAFPLAVTPGVRSVTAATYPSGFTYPPAPPGLARFVNHVPDAPLDAAATEGTVFRFNAGDLAWLVWNVGIEDNDATLANSMSWPGNSADYSNHGDPGVPLGGFGHVARGYMEPGDATDRTMHRRDWVAVSGSGLTAVQAQLNGHIDAGRTLRLIVWNAVEGGQAQIGGFAVFRLLGYSAGENWLLAELVRWDNSCGQVIGP
jgi:hypothetical protein